MSNTVLGAKIVDPKKGQDKDSNIRTSPPHGIKLERGAEQVGEIIFVLLPGLLHTLVQCSMVRSS